MPLVSQKMLRRDRIVLAAAKLFANQGYHGTSTRQIARLAEVSELTLFRHFSDKESLFWSTLSQHFAAMDFHEDLLEKMEHCAPPEVVLPRILELFADTVNYRPELIGLAAVAFLEMHPKGEAFIEERLSPALTAISQYLERCIKEGKIRTLDPATMTAALTMTALTYEGISRLIDKQKPLINRMVRNRVHAQFWLDMLAPERVSPQISDASTGKQNLN